MRKTIGWAVCVAAAVFAAGCCNCRSYQKKTRRPLAGTEWQLVQLYGEKVAAGEECFTLVFGPEERTVSGRGACYRLTGSYALGERRALKIGPLGTTRMWCPDVDREARFVEAVESATHYEMDGPMLLLLSDGKLNAIFQARP